jgi:MYXO-CTERM domain-containing protein
MWIAILAAAASARETGITGRSTSGCGNCHGANPNAATVVTFGYVPAAVAPGDIVPITLTVSHPTLAAGGLDVSATGGTLAAGSNCRLANGEITHSAPETFTGGQVTFDFVWTAPSTDAVVTLRAAGNAVNATGGSGGDAWNRATDVVITVGSGCLDLDGDLVTDCDGDCVDTDPLVHPGLDEQCNGYDDDCDGLTDDPSAVDATDWYPDADGDGFGTDVGAEVACDAPFGTVDRGGDCDDGAGSVNPGATEVCDPADTDEDCANGADGADAQGQTAWFVDADADGYGSTSAGTACDAPAGTTANPGDCDDGDDRIHPGVIETDCADPVDYNCDGATGFADNDADGFAACAECDDLDADHFPGAVETCDGADDDCDGAVDEPGATGGTLWYADADGDGFGDASDPLEACARPDGYAANADDCDDDRADVRPDAAEVWYDDVDQDCDGNDDDQDGDGVDAPTDCVDTDPFAYPGATEVWYDGVDGDCDGGDDFDADGDGFRSADHDGDDCDDDAPGTYPGAEDPPCDGVDWDCDLGPDVAPICPEDDTGGPTGTGSTTGEEQVKGDCGCATGGTGGVPLGLAALLLARRRRR